MSNYRPNAEQQAIIDHVRTGKSLKIVAGAGTGKTSTLELVGRAWQARTMLYVVYNKAAQLDADKRMPRNVQCRTSHSLAYRTFGVQYRDRMDRQGFIPSWKSAKLMGLTSNTVLLVTASDGVTVKESEAIQPGNMAYYVTQTVDRFCYSADAGIGSHHVPWVKKFSPEMNEQLRAVVVPLAVKAWEDIKSQDGVLRFQPDHYLKMYQLSRPKLPFKTILLDEAQDTNPCVAAIIADQVQYGTQVVLVGDPNQAIYEWRGAVNAFDLFDIPATLMLTGSYRFGPAVAEQANMWLELLGSDLRLKGYRKLDSVVTDTPLADATAILTRGNAGAIAEAFAAVARGQRVAIVGGGGPVEKLAKAAARLMAGMTTDHPDLIEFGSWTEVQQFCKDDAKQAGSLVPLVRIIDGYGVEAILDLCKKLVDEDRADLVVSTAHKSKGREWDRVQIGDDFQQPKGEIGELSSEELRLAYVAATRGKLVLSRGSLDWIGPLPVADETGPDEAVIDADDYTAQSIA